MLVTDATLEADPGDPLSNRPVRRCIACGAVRPKRFPHCPRCGTLHDATSLCIRCGVAVTEASSGRRVLRFAGVFFVYRDESWPEGLFALLAGKASRAPEPFMRGAVRDGPFWREKAVVCRCRRAKSLAA